MTKLTKYKKKKKKNNKLILPKIYKKPNLVKSKLKIKLNIKELLFNTHYINVNNYNLLKSNQLKNCCKFFEGFLLFFGKERKYSPSIYDAFFYYRFKLRYLNILKYNKLQLKIKPIKKSDKLYNPRKSFSFNGLIKFKYFNKLSNYYEFLYKTLNKKNNYNHIPNNSAGSKLLFGNYILKKKFIKHYKFLEAENPLNHNVLFFLNKWGSMGAEYYHTSKYKNFFKLYRYNYLYFNISIIQYIQYKNYINKLILYLLNSYKINQLPYNIKYNYLINIKYLLNNLIINLKNINNQLTILKKRLKNKLKNKQFYKNKNKYIKYLTKKWYVKNIRNSYFSFIKTMLLRYYQINIQLNFTKSNLFITLSNHAHNVIKRNTLGLIGYKKEKKKTYYASEDLIKTTFPDLFNFFKIRFATLLQILTYFYSDLFKFYISLNMNGVLNNSIQIENNLDETDKKITAEDVMSASYFWNYGSNNRIHHFTLGFAKIILYNLEKYTTLRLTLKGAKNRIKKLMHKILKNLFNFQNSFEDFLSKILFFTHNTKPHNGCRNSKKGRKKNKRRRQRIHLKVLNKKYELKKKKIKNEYKWKKKITGNNYIKSFNYLERDINIRNRQMGLWKKNYQHKYANFLTNLSNPMQFNSLYSKTKNNNPKLHHFKYGKNRDLSYLFKKKKEIIFNKDKDKIILNDITKNQDKQKRTIKFYKQNPISI